MATDPTATTRIVAIAGVAGVADQVARPELTAIISAATTTSHATPRPMRMRDDLGQGRRQDDRAEQLEIP
jgi:hypothetical protein